MIFSSLDFVISIILFYHFFFTSVVPVFNFLSKSALSCCQRYLYLILGVKLCKHGLLPSKNIWYHRPSSKWCWALTHCGSLVIEHLDGEVCSLAMILKKLLSSVAFHYDQIEIFVSELGIMASSIDREIFILQMTAVVLHCSVWQMDMRFPFK